MFVSYAMVCPVHKRNARVSPVDDGHNAISDLKGSFQQIDLCRMFLCLQSTITKSQIYSVLFIDITIQRVDMVLSISIVDMRVSVY